MSFVASLGLNGAQLAAVQCPASVIQILAPPGSGKTKTLTSRVAWFINEKSIQPWNIICLTFTIKSAREMQHRVTKLCGDKNGASVILGTFHSVCRRYLVRYGDLLGIKKNFGVADSGDSMAIISRICSRLKSRIDPKVARSRISGCKARGVTPHPQMKGKNQKAPDVDQQEIVQIYEEYQKDLEKSMLLDYDDLLLRAVDLLSAHPGCVQNVEAVLIDEFQDTNIVQFELMRLFAQKRQCVTTVGDPDQSIYGWRAAESANLNKMVTLYPETVICVLEENYRSVGSILTAAQEVIEQDVSRHTKAMAPTHTFGTKPVFRTLPSAAAEGKWIVSEIQRYQNLGAGLLNHDDFVILIRSAFLSRHIESALSRQGLPYRIVGGFRFFDRVEVKLLLDYMRVVAHPDNTDALARIINVPSRHIGDVTIKKLIEEAHERKMTLWVLIQKMLRGLTLETKLAKAAVAGIGTLSKIILDARARLETDENYHVEDLMDLLVTKLNLQKWLKDKYSEDHESRWANILELRAQASDFQRDIIEKGNRPDLPNIEGFAEAEPPSSLENVTQFLGTIALATELQDDEEKDEDGQQKPKITISTMHAAKGLEWPVVFIPAAWKGSIPHSRAEDSDEERRLLYVAMTRAQAFLNISCPKKNSTREETTQSPFLSEDLVKDLFSQHGPHLAIETLQNVSGVLRRDPPTLEKLVEADALCEVRQDEFWPLDGSEPTRVQFGENGEDDELYEEDGWASQSRAPWIGQRAADAHDNLMPVNTATTFTTAKMQYKTTMELLRASQPESKKPVAEKASSKQKLDSKLSVSDFFKPRQPKPKDVEDLDANLLTKVPEATFSSKMSTGYNQIYPRTSYNTNQPPRLESNIGTSFDQPRRAISTQRFKRPYSALTELEACHVQRTTSIHVAVNTAENLDTPAAKIRGLENRTITTSSVSTLTNTNGPSTKRTLGVKPSFGGWAARMQRERAT